MLCQHALILQKHQVQLRGARIQSCKAECKNLGNLGSDSSSIGDSLQTIQPQIITWNSPASVFESESYFARLAPVSFDYLARYAQRLPRRARPIVLTCVFGLAAGTAAVLFQLAMNTLYGATFIPLSHQRPSVFLAGSLAVILASSGIVGFLLGKLAPEASGSGIPQLKVAFWKDFGVVPFRVVWVKFIAGVLSIGGGCSLGREGPSVQLAGGLASVLGGVLGQAKQRRRMAAAAGAAAGLAAAFNTPLAAVTFVLEEIIADLNSNLLGSVLLASVIGAFVVHGLVGRQPAFKLPSVDAPGWISYALTPIIAAAAAVAGVVFQKLTMALRSRRKEMPYLPIWARPSCGALVTWAIGATVFLVTGHLGVFGLGYDDLSAGLALKLGWRIAAVLLGTKLIATVLCYGLGGCGGIFSPTLFFGGMCGLCLGGLFAQVLPATHADQITLAVVGMSACLGAVVRAPVTGILIVFEMTHDFALVPALMLGALVSQTVCRKLNRQSFYEEIIQQDGHQLEHVVPPRDLQAWQQLPVSAIAIFRPVVIEDCSADSLVKILETHPYERFPVVKDGRLAGIVLRREVKEAISAKRPVKLESAVACLKTDTVRDLQSKLIESTSLMAVILEHPDGAVIGVITLHDLLRSEVALGGAGAGV
jgi:CIC family chloride channel protein